MFIICMDLVCKTSNVFHRYLKFFILFLPVINLKPYEVYSQPQKEKRNKNRNLAIAGVFMDRTIHIKSRKFKLNRR